jgi:hypothetical protein
VGQEQRRHGFALGLRAARRFPKDLLGSGGAQLLRADICERIVFEFSESIVGVFDPGKITAGGFDLISMRKNLRA